jgi:hypothetical protein
VPEFSQPRARRIVWRTVERELDLDAAAGALLVRLRFPQQLPAAKDEEQIIQACLRGLKQSVQKLRQVSTEKITVYVYPDLGSIASLTGQRGDGHAVVESRVLHVVRADLASGGGFERLMAHEGTHIFAYDMWGAAGTPLAGEGLAVWVAGAYGGVPLADWKRRVQQPAPTVADLLGKRFRQMPENQSYPLAGILVEALVNKFGVDTVRQHFYGATASTWDAACKGAGTTAAEVESLFRSAFGKP